MQGRQGILSIHETLTQIAKCNHQNYVHMFEQREYGKVLRNAALTLDKDLVVLLLRVRDQIALDVNGQSSNGNTALDWALETRSDHQQLMVEVTGILVRAGGLTKDQLDAQGLSDSVEDQEVQNDGQFESRPSGCIPF